MNIRPYQVPVNPDFVGRVNEITRLSSIRESDNEARIIVVYGRRRVGKTELLEQVFRERNILKFEGLEGRNEEEQRRAFAAQLVDYIGFEQKILDATSSWTQLFKILSNCTSSGAWTIYFEELQWMAAYNDNLISELKYVWDNFFRKNKRLLLILCGSSPSYMTTSVVKSKSLHSRSMFELKLFPFTLAEAHEFLGKERNFNSILDCCLSVGGIPEYLKYFKRQKSVVVALAQESFVPGGFFVSEYDRIFVSSLGDKRVYKDVVNFLAKQRFASRKQIGDELNLSSGGGLSCELEKLECANIIESYVPFDAKTGSKLVRYAIADEFLQFYSKFILPEIKNIELGVYQDNPVKALPLNRYRQWLGYSLERLCRRNHHRIAEKLGFSGVNYKAGAFFRRTDLNDNSGFQIDLVFDRQDRVVTVCEIKYLSEKIGRKIISTCAQKIERLDVKNKDIQKVLIAPGGVRDDLKDALYFDHIFEGDVLKQM